METSLFAAGFLGVALSCAVFFVYATVFVTDVLSRKLVVSSALRRQFSSAMFNLSLTVRIIIPAAISIGAVISAEAFRVRGDLFVVQWLFTGAYFSLAAMLIGAGSAIKTVITKINWAIEMDQLQKLSGVLMTSARSIDGAQSKMFSIYRDNYELQSFTVNDESMAKKLGTLLDQRVTVFYAAPLDGWCLPVASFVVPDGEAVVERPYIGARYRSKF